MVSEWWVSFAKSFLPLPSLSGDSDTRDSGGLYSPVFFLQAAVCIVSAAAEL